MGGAEAEGRETCIFGVLRLRGGKPIYFGSEGLGEGKPVSGGRESEGDESNIMFGYWGGEAEGIVHMLKWDYAHAQLEACAYTTGRMCSCLIGTCDAQLACTCSRESACMHNWKCAHAQLEVCTCSIGTCSCYLVELYMLNWHAHAHNSIKC